MASSSKAGFVSIIQIYGGAEMPIMDDDAVYRSQLPANRSASADLRCKCEQEIAMPRDHADPGPNRSPFKSLAARVRICLPHAFIADFLPASVGNDQHHSVTKQWVGSAPKSQAQRQHVGRREALCHKANSHGVGMGAAFVRSRRVQS
jgi:hypothetical protein